MKPNAITFAIQLLRSNVGLRVDANFPMITQRRAKIWRRSCFFTFLYQRIIDLVDFWEEALGSTNKSERRTRSVGFNSTGSANLEYAFAREDDREIDVELLRKDVHELRGGCLKFQIYKICAMIKTLLADAFATSRSILCDISMFSYDKMETYRNLSSSLQDKTMSRS